MELIRCHIEGFGRLSDFSLSFHSGLNAHRMENGGGKTTLCAFIRAMLYGLSDSRKQSLSENERKRYLPWQGGAFGGSLTVSHEGRLYRITRRFGARPSEDLLEVFDEQTGAKTEALGTCPGRFMLSVDAEGFRDCATFSERAFAPTLENESVLALIGAQTNAGEVSLSLALERLAEKRKEYERRGGRGLLCETEAEISRNRAREAALLSIAEGLADREAEFLAAKAELLALSEKAADPTEQGKHKRAKGGRIPLLLGALLLLLCGALFGALFSPLAFLLLIPSAFLLFLALAKRKDEIKTIFSLKQTEALAVFEEKYKRCTACQKEYEAALEAQSEIAFLAEETRRLEQRRAQTEQRLSEIRKAEALLTEAGRRYREARGKATLSHFKAHLAALGEKNGESFRLDDRFSPSLLEADTYHSAEALSRAGKDAVSLSRGLAMLHAMPTAAKPPLLFDDPFLSYDDERLSGALGLLEALGEQFQILYFTCSHSRMP